MALWFWSVHNAVNSRLRLEDRADTQVIPQELSLKSYPNLISGGVSERSLRPQIAFKSPSNLLVFSVNPTDGGEAMAPDAPWHLPFPTAYDCGGVRGGEGKVPTPGKIMSQSYRAEPHNYPWFRSNCLLKMFPGVGAGGNHIRCGMPSLTDLNCHY